MNDEYNSLNTCFFTGPRDLPKEDLSDILQRTIYEIRNMQAIGCRNFISGGAVGFDMLAAWAVICCKRTWAPQIRLLLCLPCGEQEKYYHPLQKKWYRELVDLADDIETLSAQYYKGCLHVRNRRMVELSSECICYLDPVNPSRGTRYTVDYAEKRGFQTIHNVFKR